MNRKAKTKAVLAALGVILLVAALALGLHYIDSRPESEEQHQDSSADAECLYIGENEYEITHNLETYLMIGSDDSGNEDRKKNEEYHGGMADFIMLVVLDKTDNTYGFLPIDRDTITNVPKISSEGEEADDAIEQICTARWYGKDPEQGCQNTVDCVSDLLGGLEIDGYYSINMHDIGTLNDAVGGVTVNIEDDFTSEDPEMRPGSTIRLNDEQAELFVRGRMEIGDGTNESRMKRQEEFMKGFKEAAAAKMKEDPDFVNELYKELQEKAVTDIPGNRVSAMANRMYKGRSLGIFRIKGEHKEGTTLDDGLVHMEFRPSEESIAEEMTQLCSLKDNGKI